MKIDDRMSPDASPGQLSRKSGVRSVNNRPVFIVLGGLTVFLVIMVLVASDRAANQERPATASPETKRGSTEAFAKEIAGSQKDGIVQAKLAPPPSPPNPAPLPTSIAIVRPVDLDTPPLPPGTLSAPASQPMPSQQGPNGRDEEADRIRMMKQQQFDEAVLAKTGLPVIAARSGGSAPVPPAPPPSGTNTDVAAQLASVRQQIDAATRDDPTAAYQAKLQHLQALVTGSSSSGANSDPSRKPALSDANPLAQFAVTGHGDRWQMPSKPEAPRSPYELRAGFVVPATLISGINSELPGQIVAQVSQDVYDTPTGRHKLIPQGARLVGAYTNEIAYGQSRVLVAWQRIIFPDGKAMDIGAMPGGDGAGYSGFMDQVNNHYFHLFSSAFLMSAVTAGIAISQPERSNESSRPTSSGAISEALGQQLGQVTAQLISKNLNVAPTLQIRPGYRFNVIVTKDMTFSKPYQPFDY